MLDLSQLYYWDTHTYLKILYACSKFVQQEEVPIYYIPWPAKKLLPKICTQTFLPKTAKICAACTANWPMLPKKRTSKKHIVECLQTKWFTALFWKGKDRVEVIKSFIYKRVWKRHFEGQKCIECMNGAWLFCHYSTMESKYCQKECNMESST